MSDFDINPNLDLKLNNELDFQLSNIAEECIMETDTQHTEINDAEIDEILRKVNQEAELDIVTSQVQTDLIVNSEEERQAIYEKRRKELSSSKELDDKYTLMQLRLIANTCLKEEEKKLNIISKKRLEMLENFSTDNYGIESDVTMQQTDTKKFENLRYQKYLVGQQELLRLDEEEERLKNEMREKVIRLTSTYVPNRSKDVGFVVELYFVKDIDGNTTDTVIYRCPHCNEQAKTSIADFFYLQLRKEHLAGKGEISLASNVHYEEVKCPHCDKPSLLPDKVVLDIISSYDEVIKKHQKKDAKLSKNILESDSMKSPVNIILVNPSYYKDILKVKTGFEVVDETKIKSVTKVVPLDFSSQLKELEKKKGAMKMINSSPSNEQENKDNSFEIAELAEKKGLTPRVAELCFELSASTRERFLPVEIATKHKFCKETNKNYKFSDTEDYFVKLYNKYTSDYNKDLEIVASFIQNQGFSVNDMLELKNKIIDEIREINKYYCNTKYTSSITLKEFMTTFVNTHNKFTTVEESLKATVATYKQLHTSLEVQYNANGLIDNNVIRQIKANLTNTFFVKLNKIITLVKDQVKVLHQDANIRYNADYKRSELDNMGCYAYEGFYCYIDETGASRYYCNNTNGITYYLNREYMVWVSIEGYVFTIDGHQLNPIIPQENLIRLNFKPYSTVYLDTLTLEELTKPLSEYSLDYLVYFYSTIDDNGEIHARNPKEDETPVEYLARILDFNEISELPRAIKQKIYEEHEINLGAELI